MTSNSFTTQPLGPNGSLIRLYKTGDEVAWNKDGSLQYLGRIDEQIKLRGYRVELGEVSSRIYALEGAEDVAVLPIGKPATNLAAYIVRSTASELSAEQIKQSLRKHLPDYMVPASYIFVDALPKTSNGKLDKAALPQPLDIQLKASVTPTTATELRLEPIWSTLLNIEEVCVERNFFELGGHSLLAVQLVSEINKEFSLNLSVREFIERQTLREIAKRIDELLLSEALERALDDQEVFTEEEFF